ncbi:hypothetical protein [Rouxiella badensis]|uniref:hypothetical protein n=1 Tax=Rouxiella badensis TaxID=1646377 RepID=UPI0022AAC66E|nr:hypothetical protein [Rouxiella badensis]WAT08858.1 hypothetical protein O1V65_21985 [Rouxiella badensis]
MFDRDANGARKATKYGERELRLKTLMESIMFECAESQRFGQYSESYKLSDNEINELLYEVMDLFEARGYKITFSNPYLKISWEYSEG